MRPRRPFQASHRWKSTIAIHHTAFTCTHVPSAGPSGEHTLEQSDDLKSQMSATAVGDSLVVRHCAISERQTSLRQVTLWCLRARDYPPVNTYWNKAMTSIHDIANHVSKIVGKSAVSGAQTFLKKSRRGVFTRTQESSLSSGEHMLEQSDDVRRPPSSQSLLSVTAW
jgi:hypothetical protein